MELGSEAGMKLNDMKITTIKLWIVLVLGSVCFGEVSAQSIDSREFPSDEIGGNFTGLGIRDSSKKITGGNVTNAHVNTNEEEGLESQEKGPIQKTKTCQASESDLETIKKSINSKYFGNEKLNIAKKALKGKCINVSHVKSIMDLFDFEDEKLDFAKFAYDFTSDQQNYYQLSSVFEFKDTKQELNDYVKFK